MTKNKFIVMFLASLFLVSCSTASFKEKVSALKLQPVIENKHVLNPAWIKNLDPDYKSGNLPIGLGSPLIHEGIVYAGHNKGFMQAFELENGRMIWQGDDGSAYHAGAVAYKDQIIYGTVGGRVISRHALMGTIKYSVDLGASVETRGVIHGGKIFFQLRNHQVFSLDIETGKILWAYKRSVPYLTTLQRVSRPVVYNDKLLVGFADGSFVALSEEEGVLLYDTKLSNGTKFVDVDNEAFIHDNKIFISPAGGVISILDPQTGKILRTSDFSTSRAPFLQGDDFLFGTSEGELLVTDKNLVEKRRVKVSKGVITNIVKYKNKYLITATDGEVLLVDPLSLNVLETFNLGHAYSAVFGEVSASSTGDEVAFISSRNRLYIFR